MLESSVVDEKRNTFGDGDEEISQTGNEIGEILLNKQFICEAVTKVKDVKQDTVLEHSDFEATIATLEDMIKILDNRHFDKKGKSEEIITQLEVRKGGDALTPQKLSHRRHNEELIRFVMSRVYSSEFELRVKIELDNAKSFVRDLHSHLQKLTAIVETVKEHF